MNEAALSKFPLSWVREFVRRLPELDRRGRTFLAAQAGLGTEGLSLEWFAVHPDRTMRLCYIRGQDQQMVLFDRDFSLCSEDRQPALDPAGGRRLPGLCPAGSACLGPGPVPPGSAGSVRHPLPHRGGGI